MAGYFRYLRALLNARVPSSLEQSSVPPTPLAAAIRDLVMSPLQLSTQMSMEGENMLHVNQRYVCSVPLRADSIAIVPEVVNSCFPPPPSPPPRFLIISPHFFLCRQNIPNLAFCPMEMLTACTNAEA